MYKKIVLTLFVVLAILFGCASAQADDVAASITLALDPSSSVWWMAMDPQGDGNATSIVELQETGNAEWQTFGYNPSWGWWSLTSTGGNGFVTPCSVRLTSNTGEQLVLSNVITSIAGGVIATDVQFTDDNNGHHTSEPTQAPTQKPSHTQTQAPTKKPSHNQAPTEAPTKKPSHTQAPTQAPTKKPSHNQAPTEPATQKPTQKPATQAPTQKPATQAPTKKPSTPAPTQKATPAPTQKPATQAPTKKPATQAPTQAPTKKPTSSSSSGSSSGSSTDLCSVTSTSSEPLKVVVPLYEDPDQSTTATADWDAVLTAAATGVEMIVIINPDDGPVSSGPTSAYTTYMNKYKAAGITMLGYVHTLYGARALATVEADVATYASKYPGLAGIFVDEAATDSSELSYYTSLFQSIQSHSGYVNTMVNPGTPPDQGYLDASTNLMIFENPMSTWKASSMPSWVGCAPSAAEKPGYKYRFSAVAYATAQTSMPTIVSEFNAAGIGMVYVAQSSDVCCVYNSLTPYFAQLASSVMALN